MPIFFLINGMVATLIHFSIIFIIFEILRLGSAGVSSLIASVVASLISFLGNKYYVFRVHYGSLTMQATRFTLLYSIGAIFHGVFLLTWTDYLGLDYKFGFLLAVIFQALGSYFGNRYYVFKNENI